MNSANWAFSSSCSLASRKKSPLLQGESRVRVSETAGFIFPGHWAIILSPQLELEASLIRSVAENEPKAQKYEVTYARSHHGDLWPITWQEGESWKEGDTGNSHVLTVKAEEERVGRGKLRVGKDAFLEPTGPCRCISCSRHILTCYCPWG